MPRPFVRLIGIRATDTHVTATTLTHTTVINLAGPVHRHGYAMMVDKLVHHDVTHDRTTDRVIPVHGFIHVMFASDVPGQVPGGFCRARV